VAVEGGGKGKIDVAPPARSSKRIRREGPAPPPERGKEKKKLRSQWQRSVA